MNKNTVYILQKDCLDAKAGDEFEFSESSDCYSKIGGDCQIDYLSALFVENNPEWFKSKEEVNESKPTEQAPKEEQVPIKVKDIFDGIKIKNLPFGKYYTLVTNNPIPESKYQPIKEAIEWVLSHPLIDDISDNSNFYTKSELLQARRDAFDAARKIVFMFSAFPIRHPFKYLKFEDYINSLK